MILIVLFISAVALTLIAGVLLYLDVRYVNSEQFAADQRAGTAKIYEWGPWVRMAGALWVITIIAGVVAVSLS